MTKNQFSLKRNQDATTCLEKSSFDERNQCCDAYLHKGKVIHYNEELTI